MRNLYDDLGLGENASDAEIKSAYRKLAKQHHPDRAGGDADKFKQISEAHDVLSDNEKRQQYDHMRRFGGDPYGGEAGGYGGADFGDIFSSIFGDFGGQGPSRRSPRPRKGQDSLVRVDIPFNTSVLGGEMSIENHKNKRLAVKIPPGIVNGSQLRLKGQGYEGMNGGPAGDIRVEVHVAEHPDFWRENRNIVSNLHVDYLDLILGTECQVDTVHGKVQLKVPAGLGNGDRLRIRGYGVRGSGHEGDHFVVIRPVIPKTLSDEERALLHKLRDLRNK